MYKKREEKEDRKEVGQCNRESYEVDSEEYAGDRVKGKWRIRVDNPKQLREKTKKIETRVISRITKKILGIIDRVTINFE